MLFNAPIKNTNQSQIRRTKAILIVPALLSALLLSSCSEDEAPEQLPVTKVSLPKNPTQDYDYLLNGVQIDDNYMWLEQKHRNALIGSNSRQNYPSNIFPDWIRESKHLNKLKVL